MKKWFTFLVTLVFMVHLGAARVSAQSPVVEGAWFGSWASSQNQNIEQFQQMTQTNLGIVQTFVNVDVGYSSFKPTMDYVDSKGAVNLLTLTPHGYTTKDINNGKLDKYYSGLAKQLKGWNNGKEIWVRILHEGNGNWYSWSIGDSKVNTADSYKKAFQHIVDLFRKEGATNVKWVYNVNNSNVGKNAGFTNAYPGKDYVDYVSIDGYNWGTQSDVGKSTGFSEIFDAAYQALAPLGKPVLITEIGCSESGTDKAAWVTDVYTQLKNGVYPNLKALVWFDENKEYDWRINSSAAALTAYINK